jgi:hypothetical protein
MDILDKVSSSIFKKTGGTIMGDLFGSQGSTLVTYLNSVFNSTQYNGEVLKYFYQQLYSDFSPDINGYTLLFFIPPDLSGYRIQAGNNLYSQEDPSSYMKTVGKIMTFAAIDFTPPQSQIRTETVTTRSGGIPIASEISESDTLNITFLDNNHLDIYMFHHIWLEYIREILEGTIEPDPRYYTEPASSYEFSEYFANVGSGHFVTSDEYYGAIDYAASCYIVKYRPDMQTVTFVAKCVGLFPQSLPNKELIGSRESNQIVILPFTYSCSGYREGLYTERSNGMWIFDELDTLLTQFITDQETPLFGGFLGNILNNALGSVTPAFDNLTGNFSKLKDIINNTQNGVGQIWDSVRGVSQPDGWSKIFRVNYKNNI